MFISLTTAKFLSRFTAKFWNGAIVATKATIVATTAMIAPSLKENQFLIFVGQGFFFVHNRENNGSEFEEISRDRNLDIDLGHFPWAVISYRLGQDFRSGRYRRELIYT